MLSNTIFLLNYDIKYNKFDYKLIFDACNFNVIYVFDTYLNSKTQLFNNLQQEFTIFVHIFFIINNF